MAATLTETAPKWRWVRTLSDRHAFSDDLGGVGESVGPRSGPDKRTHGQKEDYIVRRVLVAFNQAHRLRFPVEVHAEREAPREPDFEILLPDGKTLGLEATEAGEENYQAWLTRTEAEADEAELVPLEASRQRTADEFVRAIQSKVTRYDDGHYRTQMACDLAVYDNTAWGGFLDKREILTAIGRPNSLLGRFRQVHLVWDTTVILDCFGSDRRKVDLRYTYEIDFIGWIRHQSKRLRLGRTDQIDLEHIAEELEGLGRSERRALASHLRNLNLHLLKWKYQPAHRGESWRLSILNARSEIYELLSQYPSLRPDFLDLIESEYRLAARHATKETGVLKGQVPETCPFTRFQLVDPDFFPEE